MSSTWKWPKIIQYWVENELFLYFTALQENKSPWRIRTCRLVDKRNTNCATEIGNQLWRFKMLHNALKSVCCDVLSEKVEVKGCCRSWRWYWTFVDINLIKVHHIWNTLTGLKFFKFCNIYPPWNVIKTLGRWKC